MEHIYSSYLFQFSLTGYTMMISISRLVCLSEVGGYSHGWGLGGHWTHGL